MSFLLVVCACHGSGSASAVEPMAGASTVPKTSTQGNLFADLEIELVQVFEDDIAGHDDLVVFEGPDVRLNAAMSFGFDRIALTGTVRGRTVSFNAGIDARSPGRRFEVGGSQLHVQLVGADNDVSRGPLLVFFDNSALPCFRPQPGLTVGQDQRRKTADFPIHIVNPNVDHERIRHETRARLNLSASLLAGQVTPGMSEARLFAERQ
jgi:hypothetical protein